MFTGSRYNRAGTGARDPSWDRTTLACTVIKPLAGATTLYHVVATTPGLLPYRTVGAASSGAMVAKALESVKVARAPVPVPVKEIVGRATRRSLTGGAGKTKGYQAGRGHKVARGVDVGYTMTAVEI